MYVCMYVCMYLCVYVCVCMYVCVHTYICMYVCMYVRMYIRMYVCVVCSLLIVPLTLNHSFKDSCPSRCILSPDAVKKQTKENWEREKLFDSILALTLPC